MNPYYQAYAAPYVDIVRPYTHNFNKRIYIPTAKFAEQNFYRHVAPRSQAAILYSKSQWHAKAMPHLNSLRKLAIDWYTAVVIPRISSVADTISPYYKKSSEAVIYLQRFYILPHYVKLMPTLERVYFIMHDVLMNNIVPWGNRSSSGIVTFVNDVFFPRVTGLYTQNIEPQLVKIGDKLAGYRQGKKLRAIFEEDQR